MVIFEEDAILFAAGGGILLGIATSLNYVLRGKVTGMSGIVYGIVSLNKNEMPQKLSIIGGMFFISSVFYLIFGEGSYHGFEPFGPEKKITQWTTYPGYALAGLLVGFGTKMGNGCTSGHGLCGMARLSIRSFVAVGVFLLTAIAIGTLSYQIDGLGPFENDQSLNPEEKFDYDHNISSYVFLALGLVLPAVGFFVKNKYHSGSFETSKQLLDQFVVFLVGALFAVGLMMAGMTRRINILQFLWIGNSWNPQLMFVLGFGVTVNFIFFQFMIRKDKNPLFGGKLFNPANNQIDAQLVVGAFIFGLGWGIGGLCPGPFLALFPTFTIGINLIWGVGLVCGQLIAAKVSEHLAKSSQKNLTAEQTTTNKQLLREELSETKS